MESKLAQKLEKIISQLLIIQREIQLSSSEFPKDRLKLIEQRICLYCGKQIAENDKSIRGVHEACRQDQNRKLELSEHELVRQGLLAPRAKTGRKPVDRVQKIEESVAKAQPIVDSIRKSKRTKPKQP